MNLSLTKNSPAPPHRRPAIFPPSTGGRRRNSRFLMTPSLRWKLEDRRSRFQFQARKIAAHLWQVFYREISGGLSGGRRRYQGEKRHRCLEQSRNGEIEAEQWLERRHCLDSSNNGIIKIKAALPLPATEYWNPETPDTAEAAESDNSHSHRGGTMSEKEELAVAQTRIRKLEFQHRNSKKKIEHLKGELEENRAMYKNQTTNMMKLNELDEERKVKPHQRIEILNANLTKELAEARLKAKKYKQEHEKEKKNRELLEEVCTEMARLIVGDRAKMEALKRESMKLCEELEEERNMLQMAEIWREERVQMKLIDAKLALEDKYNQMNKLIHELENLMASRNEKSETQSSALSLIEEFKEDGNFGEAIEFLRGIFELYDGDGDGALRPRDLEELFSTAPESPWNEAPYRDSAERNAMGGLSIDDFLSLWSLMTLLNPVYTIENLIYIGYSGDPASSVRITRKRRLDRKKQQLDRNVLQCFVFGPKKAGKSGLLDAFLARPFSGTYTPTTEERYAVNVVDQPGGAKKTLILREIPEEGVKKLLSGKESLAACDIALFVHDSSDESSWKKATDLLVEVASHGEDTGYEVPCLIVAAKDDLDSFPLAIQDSTRVSQDMGIEAPIPTSTKLGDFNYVFRRIASAAEHPHLSIPETEAGKSRKQYHKLINRSLMFVSVGAAVTIVGLAAYRVYLARKSSSS